METIEKLFDPENNDPITLVDDQDNEVDFEQIAVIPYEQKIYALLKPMTPVEGVGEDEALVFVIEVIEGEATLVIEDNLDTIDAVFSVYEDLLRENGIDVEE